VTSEVQGLVAEAIGFEPSAETIHRIVATGQYSNARAVAEAIATALPHFGSRRARAAQANADTVFGFLRGIPIKGKRL
jgi:hypothetical protein